jgi:hypothetical protein
MIPCYLDKSRIILDVLGLAARHVTPEKGPGSHRLILAVYPHRVVRRRAAKIRPPGSMVGIAVGPRINQKLVAAIAEPKAKGISMAVGIQRSKPKRTGIEHDDQLVIPSAVGGQDAIAALRKCLYLLGWCGNRRQR